tara:strand:- start:228 stop:668 length:441 start_codon:yes stop_codon:yes gene_type:complete
MNLLREYIRDLLVEQEEERSELDKIKQVFASNAIQAIELADLVGLGEDPAVKGMKKILEVAVGYLDLITTKHPDPVGAIRLEGWMYALRNSIQEIYPEQQGTEGKEIYDMFNQVFYHLKGRISLERAEVHINHLSTWAGHPVELPK